MEALKALGEIIQRDYSSVSGFMMERYFMKKFQEEGRYVIGKWWDRKGENEIDLIVVDPIQKEVWLYELKKQDYRYKETYLNKSSSVTTRCILPLYIFCFRPYVVTSATCTFRLSCVISCSAVILFRNRSSYSFEII